MRKACQLQLPNVSDGWLLLWLVIDLVMLAVLALVGVGMTISQLRGMGTLDDQMLILMPERFVMRLGPSGSWPEVSSARRALTPPRIPG